MTPAQGGRASLPAPLRALTLGSEPQNERLLLHDDRVSAHTDGVRDPGIAVGMVEVTGAALVLDPLNVVGVHSGIGARRVRSGAGGLSLIHISEPTRLGMISYAVFCLKKKKKKKTKHSQTSMI